MITNSIFCSERMLNLIIGIKRGFSTYELLQLNYTDHEILIAYRIIGYIEKCVENEKKGESKNG